MPDPMRGSPSSSISSAGGGPRAHPQTPPRPGPPNPVIMSKHLPMSPPPTPFPPEGNASALQSLGSSLRTRLFARHSGIGSSSLDCDVRRRGSGWAKAAFLAVKSLKGGQKKEILNLVEVIPAYASLLYKQLSHSLIKNIYTFLKS